MDTLLENFHGGVNGFRFENGHISGFSNQNTVNEFNFDDRPVDSSSHPTGLESPCDSGPSSFGTNKYLFVSSETNKYSNPSLRYISDMLMDEEDDLERKPCMLQDCLALQAAEKSFYDVLGHSYPSSPRQNPNCFHAEDINSPDGNNFGCTPSFESNSSCATDNSSDSDWINGVVNSPENFLDVPDLFTETLAQSNPLVDLGVTIDNSVPRGKREKRSHWMDDSINEDEGRGSKLSAVFSDESETSEIFDEVLLCYQGTSQSMTCSVPERPQTGVINLNGDSGGSNGKQARSKKGANRGTTVDLWTLLTQCAQSVASYDQRNANELLKQIRQHSSPFGDGLQRLAHYFANGLEARLGLAAGTPSYTPHSCNGATAAEMLKAYKLYITAAPFLRISNFLANRTILKLVEDKPRLHIIDFGICYGFQWPCLIQRLSERQGGPPKLRITGIDLPQSGFRPAERVEETGRRLVNYCRRFNVPFEYNCLAQKWETIRLEDLKVDRTEITVVNCLYRLKNLPDETVSLNSPSPRDAVLNLIRRINPKMFIHGVVNGTYNAPFFVTRFREALFQYSSLFDMFEANVAREDPERLLYERGIFGRDAMNVIACEGAERVERPETYKQWQVRNHRARFKQLRVDAELFSKAREMVKKEYHKDFGVDDNGKWILQGWKGRIIYALSCWKPA